MAEKFWTKERLEEKERLGDAFWTPECVKEYKENIGCENLGYVLTNHFETIPCPQKFLEKIRWRDVQAGDVIYYRTKSYTADKKPLWEKRAIVRVKRISHRNLIEITWKCTGFSTPKHTTEVHGKNFTRLIWRTSNPKSD